MSEPISEINKYFPAEQLPLINFTSIDNLPDEVMLLIFSSLQRTDMPDFLNCSLVCKKWKNLAEDNQLWRELAIRLRIERNHDDPINYKNSIIKLSELATPLFLNAKSIMDADVLTSNEINSNHLNILISNLSEEVKQEQSSELWGKINDKFEKAEIFKKGMNAGICIYKLKPSFEKSLYKMAEILEKKYGNANGWLELAQEKCNDDSEGALNIFKKHLIQNTMLKSCFYLCYISIMSKKNIEKTFQFLKDYPLLQKEDSYERRASSAIVLNRLLDEKRYDLIELGMDEKLWAEPMNALTSLLKYTKNEVDQGRIVKKYINDIENSEKHYLHIFLPYLLKEYSSSYCLSLFEKHNMSKIDYWRIQENFKDINGDIEYNKIQTIIDSMKK
ncbi:MAG: F-box protein [Parachlamydiaceae bacterium]|nr:F-box protein [Parachlamydiaceae bacterium]